MVGSWKVQVRKRDGSREPFSAGKLAGSVLRALPDARAWVCDVQRLAEAVGIYLRRCRRRRISSAALFEMMVQVLRQSGLAGAAGAMSAHRVARRRRRRRLRVRHAGGQVTRWEKGWVGQLAQRVWLLSPAAARIVAGQVEEALTAGQGELVDRDDVLGLLNECVAAYGLADAMPVRQPVRR